jgi:hypothetical protein
MTLGNMREQDVRHLIAYCLNDACRHPAVIDVSNYADDVEVPWFQERIKCRSVVGAGVGSTCGRTAKKSRAMPRSSGSIDAFYCCPTIPRPCRGYSRVKRTANEISNSFPIAAVIDLAVT